MREVTKILLKVSALVAYSYLATSCATIKPYEKEYLLDPLMSDERTSTLSPSFMRSALGRFEHLSGVSGATSGNSCPTCGG